MKHSYKLLMGLAMLVTIGFAGTSLFSASPANALRLFVCPDGSTPSDFQCPETCDDIACPFGQACEIQNNAPICVQTITCANVRCAQDTKCIETATGPQCVPTTPTPTCANTLCSAGLKCIETYTGPQCVTDFSQNTSVYSQAFGNFQNTFSNFQSNVGNSTIQNTFQNAQNHFGAVLQQQQQSCIAAGNVWTGSYCKFW